MFTDEYIGVYRVAYTAMTDVTELMQMKIENGNFHISEEPISLPEALRDVIMITLAGIRERGRADRFQDRTAARDALERFRQRPV